MYDEIGKILGIDRTHNMVIIGAGNLASALVNSGDFAKRGFLIQAVFDNNPTLEGLGIGDLKIKMMSEFSDYIKNNDIEIVVLTVPRQVAKDVAHIVVDCGIKAIWNFAHTDLNLSDDIIVENVHLSESLMRLSYTIANNEIIN